MNKHYDTLIPPDDLNRAIEEDRVARKRGEISSLNNPAEISREVLAAIHRHVNPDIVGQTIASLLSATRTLKNGDILPDTRAQEAAAKLYMSYAVGMPVQRSEVVNVNLDADKGDDLEQRMRQSPAMRESFRAMIARIDGAEAIEAEIVPE
jgi:hypothetical protein